MAKIDIITLTGFTAIDGSLIESGATVKFETLFFIGTTVVEIRPRVFRSRELFEMGFQPVKTIELPNDFKLLVPEAEYYTLTPQAIYEKVRDYLNNLFGADVFEINIIN
jgi:hypothetical protein